MDELHHPGRPDKLIKRSKKLRTQKVLSFEIAKPEKETSPERGVPQRQGEARRGHAAWPGESNWPKQSSEEVKGAADTVAIGMKVTQDKATGDGISYSRRPEDSDPTGKISVYSPWPRACWQKRGGRSHAPAGAQYSKS